MKVYISHSNDFDYESELYLPLEQSDLLKEHELILPHRADYKDVSVADIFKDCDAIFAEVSLPSTGQGLELGRASERNIPIICSYKSGRRYSSSLRFITDSINEYQTTDQLISNLVRSLAILKAR